jgi:hypothetical protein
MPLPAFLRWQVNPGWVGRTLVLWVLLWAVVVTLLALRRDSGPFPAPSPGSVRNLHLAAASVQQARLLLEQGDAAGAEARAVAAIDQAPGSAAARRTLAEARHRLGVVQASAQSLQQAAGLLDEGRDLYNRGQYGRAVQRFEQALALDPGSELAQSYLDLARERIRTAPRQQPTPTLGGGLLPGLPSGGSAASAPPPTPGSARITVFFNSPLNAGSLVVTVDGQSLAEVPFDFTRKGLLGIKRKGTGQVKRVLLVPSGRHTVGIQLNEAERGSIGEATFTESLTAGSDWTLRTDLPEGAAVASFYLVKAAGR